MYKISVLMAILYLIACSNVKNDKCHASNRIDSLLNNILKYQLSPEGTIIENSRMIERIATHFLLVDSLFKNEMKLSTLRDSFLSKHEKLIKDKGLGNVRVAYEKYKYFEYLILNFSNDWMVSKDKNWKKSEARFFGITLYNSGRFKCFLSTKSHGLMMIEDSRTGQLLMVKKDWMTDKNAKNNESISTKWTMLENSYQILDSNYRNTCVLFIDNSSSNFVMDIYYYQDTNGKVCRSLDSQGLILESPFQNILTFSKNLNKKYPINTNCELLDEFDFHLPAWFRYLEDKY